MKDVQACEKPRGAGNEALIRGYPNGETRPFTERFRRSQKPLTSKVSWGCQEGRERCVKGHPMLNT